MNTSNIQIDDDAIDIREVFKTIYRYRYMIVILVVLFTFASTYYAYFKPNVYQASATVEVGVGDTRGQDILTMAMDTGTGKNSATEMEIIKSRFLAKKALEKVNFTHKYYTTRKFKEIELYKESPFEVGMLKGYGISFDFFPVDEKSYRLVVKKAVDANGNPWRYDEVLPYGEEITTEHFHLNIIRTKEAQDKKYRFVILKNGSPYGGVGVSLKGRYSTILQISYTDMWHSEHKSIQMP